MNRSSVRKTMLVALAALLQLVFAPRSFAGSCAPTGALDSCCCVATAPAAGGGSCCEQPDVDPFPAPGPGPCGCEDGGDELPAVPEATTPERDEVAIDEMALGAGAEPHLGRADGHRPIPVPRARAPVHVLHCVYVI